MISEKSYSNVLTGRSRSGLLLLMGWDLPTWHYAYAPFTEGERAVRPCLRLKLDKRVVSGDGWTRDKEPRWRDEARMFVEVSTDQRLLLSHGPWIRASDLVPGKTMIQSMCGNGHATLIEEVIPVGEKPCVELVVPGIASYIIAGIVLEADDGRRGSVGVRDDRGSSDAAGGGGGRPSHVDEPPQRLEHSPLA